MSVLSAATQKQVEDELVKDGFIAQAKLDELRKKAAGTNAPLFQLLVTEGGIDGEDLTKTTAKITKVPYVNLSNAPIDQATLELLPQEIAERYMAVPLWEMQHRLVVAMLDADNVQAVDFLSNKIGRPLKVYAASEQGIRAALSQYKANIGDLGGLGQEEQAVKTPENSKEKSIRTIVQDSPISKALSTILEYAAKNRASDIHHRG